MFEHAIAQVSTPAPVRIFGSVKYDPMDRVCKDDWLRHQKQSQEKREGFLVSIGADASFVGTDRERGLRCSHVANLIRSGEIKVPDRDAFPSFETFLLRHKGYELLPPISLRGQELLVFTSVMSIVLTPDQPAYDLAKWQFDGIANEAIIATGVYVYSVENLASTARIELRTSFDTGLFEFDQDERRELYDRYGIQPNVSHNLQSAGHVEIAAGRAVVFSNHMQHRFAKFQLAQPDRDGHCKMLIFSLVKPGTLIPSTLTVPSQREQTVVEQLRSVLPCVVPDPVLRKILGFATTTHADVILEAIAGKMWQQRTSSPVSEEIPYFCFPVDLKGEYVSDEDSEE